MSIDIANETENRLLKSGKDKEIVYSAKSWATFDNASSTFSKTSSTFLPRNYLRNFIWEVHCKLLISNRNEGNEGKNAFGDKHVIELPPKALVSYRDKITNLVAVR